MSAKSFDGICAACVLERISIAHDTFVVEEVHDEDAERLCPRCGRPFGRQEALDAAQQITDTCFAPVGKTESHDEPRCRLCGRTEQEAKTCFVDGVCDDHYGCQRAQIANLKAKNEKLEAEKDMLIRYALGDLSPEDTATIELMVAAAKMMKEMGETVNSDSPEGQGGSMTDAERLQLLKDNIPGLLREALEMLLFDDEEARREARALLMEALEYFSEGPYQPEPEDPVPDKPNRPEGQETGILRWKVEVRMFPIFLSATGAPEYKEKYRYPFVVREFTTRADALAFANKVERFGILVPFEGIGEDARHYMPHEIMGCRIYCSTNSLLY